MKLSEYIRILEELLKINGDMECIYSKDDEGNQYNLVKYMPSVLYKHINDKNERNINIYCLEDLEDLKLELEIELGEVKDSVEKVVCVN